MAESDLVAAGVVGKPHGLDGSFYALSSDPELLDTESFVVAGVARRLVRRAGTTDRPILRLEGIDTREAIAALHAAELLVPKPDLDDDEFWTDDLVGCDVVGYGTVARVLAYPSCELLELEDGRLIPVIHDAIAAIDLDARRIEVREGFLNAD